MIAMHDAGDRNHRILCSFRHGTLPVPEDFIADVTALPTPGPGQLLARTVYLSLAPPEGLPEADGTAVMAGDAVAQVMESRHPDYRPGEFILARTGWQQFALSSGGGVRRLDPATAPVSTALGSLGSAGLKGYVSLVYVADGRPGQTVLVTGAAGPVGGTAAQVARLTGLRAVGIESSAEKCEYAVRELGLAACLSSAGPDLAARIRQACPEGIDVCIDESGGELLGLIAPQLARGARLVLCGRAESYLGCSWPAGGTLRSLVVARASVRCLVVEDHLQRLPELIRVVGGWIRSGVFRYREDITEGLSNAPAGFCRLLRGATFGNALVRVAAEHR
jgi:NADPH-dependent curcumin reductase CurA